MIGRNLNAGGGERYVRENMGSDLTRLSFISNIFVDVFSNLNDPKLEG